MALVIVPQPSPIEIDAAMPIRYKLPTLAAGSPLQGEPLFGPPPRNRHQSQWEESLPAIGLVEQPKPLRQTMGGAEVE